MRNYPQTWISSSLNWLIGNEAADCRHFLGPFHWKLENPVMAVKIIGLGMPSPGPPALSTLMTAPSHQQPRAPTYILLSL